MTPVRIDLAENGEAREAPLSAEVGSALVDTGFVDACQVPGTQLWRLKPGSKVGAIRVGDVAVHVVPKIPVGRVVFLLQHSRAGIAWRSDRVDVEQAPDLMHAILEVFERITTKALQQGLIQGYRVRDEALPVVRGRIREADQVRRRFGLVLPVEVQYDDFTVDTPENRLLRAAVIISRRVFGLDPRLRHRLMRLDLQLAEVTPVARGRLEQWHPTRLNARLHDALRLAEVIIAASSFEPRGDGLTVTGFVINMAKVFEDFVCATLGQRLRSVGGTAQTQDPWKLDLDGSIGMRPDLVWYADGVHQSAVIDAKYKAERPQGFPDADVYQLLAYCTALELSTGHLVYAKGNEQGRTYRIAHAGKRITAHTLDLAKPPDRLLEDVNELAAVIARDSSKADSTVAPTPS